MHMQVHIEDASQTKKQMCAFVCVCFASVCIYLYIAHYKVKISNQDQETKVN